MPPRLLLLRHGQSLANERGMIASTLEHAGEALGLTALGREQVRRSLTRAQAREALAQPLLLICSPLLRARESAEVAAKILGSLPRIDARLTERNFGDFELESDDCYELVWAADREDPTHRRWGVESVAGVLRRAGGAVKELALEERTATVVLCTHGDVASALVCASMGVPLRRHREVGALGTGMLRELPPAEALLEALR